MKLNNTQRIIGGVVLLIAAIWLYKKYQSKKAIVQAKDDELAVTSDVPQIPKMYIRVTK